MENTRQNRMQLLKRIITEKQISDQLQLLDEMRRNGIDTTQATISRDLQKMNVTKVPVRPGVYKYEVMEKSQTGDPWEKLSRLFQNMVCQMKSTGNLLVIRTIPGSANSVAVVCDNLDLPQILGTIAGDDTVLVIVDTEANRRDIEQKFEALLE